MFGLLGKGFKVDPSKIAALGAGLQDLDGTLGSGNFKAALSRLEKEKQQKQQQALVAQASQGLTPQQAALAQLNPQAFSNQQINNQFLNPLAVQQQQNQNKLAQNTIGNTQFQQGISARGADRADTLAQNTIGNTQFNQGIAARGADRADAGLGLQQQGFEATQQQRGIDNGFKERGLGLQQQNADISRERLNSAEGEFGLTPVFGRDADGNRILIQTNKAGGVRAAGLPEGVRLEDDRFKSQERVEGTERGKANANLPSALNNANRTLDTVDQLLNHPGLSAGTGKSAILPAIPGTKRKAFDVANKQLNGQVFLQGFEALKGGGVITEVEGLKAEQALARANQAQSQEDYTAALEDYTKIVAGGVAAAHERAGAEIPQRFKDILNDAKKNDDDGFTDLGNGIRIREKK